ncbi:MAG TPA: DUF932 domain-containing protein [bacterium]|nr:DUF932 domain-containing protein [bacterium]
MQEMSSENLKSILFPIIERPVYVDGIPVENKKAICRGDTGEVLGVVGNRYTALDNGAVMSHIDQILGQAGIPYQIVKGHSIRNGAKTSIEISFPDKRFVVDGKDEMYLRGHIGNSFDMSSAVTLNLGFHRIVCSNGAMISTSERTISVGHYRDVSERTVKELMTFLGDKFVETRSFIQALTQHSFRAASDVEELLFKNKIVAGRYHRRLVDAWHETGYSTSGWQVFNIFTSVITHEVRANEFSKMGMLTDLSKESRRWLEEPKTIELAA